MDWVFKKNQDGSHESVPRFLSEASGMSLLASTVCFHRGITNLEQLDSFLNPKLSTLTHPFKILNLKKAAQEILRIQSGPQKLKLRVFTDYDVDGTTGAALLTWVFREFKFNFDVKQPDRFRDGYGLNVNAVEEAVSQGVEVLITVDCGITNFDALKRAQELNLKVVIVDHHKIDPIKGVPDVFAAIDPHQPGDESGLTQLCGCALAFYLSMGLRILAREQGYFENEGIKEPSLKEHLDLVVIATAADMVPLTGDNRVLVRHGLSILKNTTKVGLRELMRVSGIEVKLVSPSNLGFALGPRINASGRMGSAETAYQVLTTEDSALAVKLANELEQINSERAETQNLIWDEVREQVNQEASAGFHSAAIVVASRNWHEGVVGIVASKVTDHFKKPAIVLAEREDGTLKGSVRSFGGADVLQALHECKELLKSYGGHKFAAGLSLSLDHFAHFRAQFNQAVLNFPKDKKSKELPIEGLFSIEDFNAKTLAELESLAPFGPGNPEPIIAVEAYVTDQRVLKGRHLKLNLESEMGTRVEGIWFNAAERLEFTELVEKSAQYKKRCVFAGIPEMNRFLGRATPSFRIKEAKHSP